MQPKLKQLEPMWQEPMRRRPKQREQTRLGPLQQRPKLPK